jgi:folate-binding protein YgfZ
MTHPCPLIGDAHCILIEGNDARRFAQAQFSGNVDALAPGYWQWNAWLTPQGRVSALMHLVDAGDGRLLAVLRGGDADASRAGLARYLLRQRAALRVEAFACRSGDPATMGTVAIDAGEIVLGYGPRSLRLGTTANEPPDADARTTWRLEDIRQGWPSLPGGELLFLPPALGLEHLQAVSFDKGCYPGQEIAARLHYRGGHKHRLYHLQAPATPPAYALALPEDTTCLDAVTHGGITDALVVGPLDLPQETSAATRPFRVISSFDS